MSDLKKLVIPLLPEEMTALQKLAKKDCRLDYEQVRYVLRNYLIWTGELPNDQSAVISVNLLEMMQPA
jgi:hypothetical protein